jgi:antitoxin (DNA-binding transcriptional repressor) of toxin-antitoxin stability system
VKTIGMEQTTLDACLQDAQRERIVITRNGIPVALIVGLEGMDEEQVRLGSSDSFWKLIAERRQQGTVSRDALEEEIGRRSPAHPE